MKSKFVVWVAPVALAGAFALPAAAQDQSSGSQASGSAQTQATAAKKNPNATPGINKRQRNQQHRIRQGVKSGQLTKSETRHLEKEQNKASRDIYRTKHNDRTAKPKSQEPAQQPPAQEQPPQQ